MFEIFYNKNILKSLHIQETTAKAPYMTIPTMNPSAVSSSHNTYEDSMSSMKGLLISDLD